MAIIKTQQEWRDGLIEIYGRPLTEEEQAAAQARRNTWLALTSESSDSEKQTAPARTVLTQVVMPDGSFEYSEYKTAA